MAIKISGTTVIDDSRNLTNVGGIKTVGGQSLLGSGDIDVGGNLVSTPSITSPTNGQTNFNGAYVSSTFSGVESYIGTHDYVDWQLATDANFNTIVDSYSGTSNLTGWSTPLDSSPLTTYYVRVRYGSDSHLSDWSDSISYTTPNIYVATPSITSPSNGATAVPEFITANSSAFSVINGSDTHVSSDWQLATDASFNNVVEESIGDTTNKVSYEFGTGSYAFATSTTYYIRVRYNSSNFGTSPYSSTISFTTNSVFSGEQVYTTPGNYTFTVPTGVTSISVVAVGAGGRGGQQSYYSGSGTGATLAYLNNYSVTPGQNFAVTVAAENNGSDSSPGGASTFSNVCQAPGGYSAGQGYNAAYSANYTGTGGGLGGRAGMNGQGPNGYNGGGGAGGYSGNGGDGGGNNSFSPSPYGGNAGNGGGGGGGAVQGGNVGTGGGGGVGIFGEGPSGAGGSGNSTQGGFGGSGGQNGQTGNSSYGSPGGRGGAYGGGGGGSYNNSSNATGAQGAVRIIWSGSTRTFPSTNVGAT
jgi:hypothetical protein